MRRTDIFLCLFVVIAVGANAVGTAGKQKKLEEINRNRKRKSIPLKLDAKAERKKFITFLLSDDVKTVRAKTDKFLKEGTKSKRRHVYGALYAALLQSTPPTRRRILLDHLLQGLSEHGDLRNSVDSFLSRLKLCIYEEDFSQTAKQSLTETIEEEGFKHLTILLTGIAELKRYYPHYRELGAAVLKPEEQKKNKYDLRYEKEKYGPTEWAAALVLARSGEKKWINAVLSEVKEEPFNRKILFLLDDVAYLRQQQAIDYLQHLLNSEEELTGGVDAVERGAYHVISPLRQIIRGFPHYDSSLVKNTRKWMNAHEGEWEFYTSASQWPEVWKRFPAR
ncbi:MAG: hypothetical protein KGZ25_12655 [Planctomycetes bacterium]|nr:hypothetical protein [Planctomycetota bacterium]